MTSRLAMDKSLLSSTSFPQNNNNNNNNNTNIIKIFLPYAGFLKPYTLKTPKNSDISFHLCAISYQVFNDLSRGIWYCYNLPHFSKS